MPDGLGNFLQTALTILTLASLAGVGLMQGTLRNLRADLADARARIGDRDSRIAELEKAGAKEQSERKAREVAMQAQIDAQKDQIQLLKDEVTGKPEWVSISKKIDDHATEAQRQWGTIEELLRELLKNILDLLKKRS